MEENFFQRQLAARRKSFGLSGGGLGFDSGSKFFERTLGDELTAVNDGDVTAKTLDDFEHMGCKENGSPAGDHTLEHRFQGAGGNRVDAFERLVEKEDLRAVDNGGGEGKFLLHAVGIIGDELVGLIGELHELEELCRAPGAGVAVEAVHAADEGQVLGSGQAAKESQTLGYDADLAFNVDDLVLEVEPQNFNSARGRSQQPGQHLDGGGLAGAVGAEKTEELSGGDAEVHILHGDKVSEAASQIFGCDRRRGVVWSIARFLHWVSNLAYWLWRQRSQGAGVSLLLPKHEPGIPLAKLARRSRRKPLVTAFLYGLAKRW